MFEHAKKGFPYENEYIQAGEPLEIPVFEDMMGNTAIDDALGLVEGRSMGDMIKKGWRQMFRGEDQTEDQEEMRKMKLRNREMNLQMAHIIF